LAPRRLAYSEKHTPCCGIEEASVQSLCRFSSTTTRVVVECFAEQAADAKAWLERAMIEGVDTVMNSAGKARVPVEVEARMVRRWGEGG
jgi:hypothetical protein